MTQASRRFAYSKGSFRNYTETRFPTERSYMPIFKRSIVLRGNRTSVSLEDDFWQGLKEIARLQRKPLHVLVGELNDARDSASNLSSVIRSFVLAHYRSRSAQDAAPS